jgi:PEP-CTERM motif
MKYMKFGNIIQVATFGAALGLGVASTAAFADTVTVSYLGVGVQAQTGSAFHVEDFNSGLGAGNTTTFGGSGITGTYATTPGFTTGFQINSADQYGGANGSGNYIVSLALAGVATSYTLTLDTGVNYFGYWLSAQDPGNQVQIYDNSTLLYTFTPTDLITALGACSGGAYCGNPNSGFSGDNDSQPYAFVDFYVAGETFNKIVFTELNSGNGYESDNHTVANLSAPPPGTLLASSPVPSTSPVPEPSGLALLGTGVIGVAASLRRKLLTR